MQTITRTADDPYHGTDGDNSLTIAGGQTVDVSDEKAAQLLRDFPDDFKTASARKAPAKTAKSQGSSAR